MTNLETTAKSKMSGAPMVSGVLQRQCACGQHTIAGGECAECGKKQMSLQRATQDSEIEPRNSGSVPTIVHDVLRSPGQPLDTSTRSFFEPRLGHDFSGVRVHTDSRAAESARAVNALAYTVGQNIVFNQPVRPADKSGRNLLAHELTHVVQQRVTPSSSSVARLTLDAPNSALETEAKNIGASVAVGGVQSAPHSPIGTQTHTHGPILSRADPDAVGHTMTLGRAARTGLQFFPTNVTDTRVGVVTAQGGRLDGGIDRLNVIIGENVTPRTLARQLLPLWITATPATPPGAAAPLPLDIITEDELAQGLLVYNRYYLPVPAMTDWRAGLRFPLPVEIEDATGMATLNPLQIRGLAGAFLPAWAPLLDLRASAVAAAPVANLQADVTAFLAARTTAFERGIHLGTRALRNPGAELPFIQETFRQLGAAGFDVALAFVNNLMEPEIRLLSAQRDGNLILIAVGNVLAAAPPPLTAAQQATFDRLNLVIAIAPQVAPPGSARTRAEKSITVDTVKLDQSTHNPKTDIAVANAIFSQCNVRVLHGVDATATNAETTGWLGDTDLRAANNCNGPSAEERRLVRGASTRFGFNARFRAFFPATFTGVNGSGYSCIASDTLSPILRNTAVVQNDGDTDSLAHELGHILINLGPHTRTGLMSPRPDLPNWRLDEISEAHCTRLYNHA